VWTSAARLRLAAAIGLERNLLLFKRSQDCWTRVELDRVTSPKGILMEALTANRIMKMKNIIGPWSVQYIVVYKLESRQMSHCLSLYICYILLHEEVQQDLVLVLVQVLGVTTFVNIHPGLPSCPHLRIIGLHTIYL
jgi:hypothetical protein